MARSTLSLGMLWARAAWMALRNRGLAFGSPPPVFAAMLISLDNLLKIWPRLVSMAPLKRLTFDHLLCPAIDVRIGLKLQTCLTNNSKPWNETPSERMASEEKNYRDYSTATRSICQSCRDGCVDLLRQWSVSISISTRTV